MKNTKNKFVSISNAPGLYRLGGVYYARAAGSKRSLDTSDRKVADRRLPAAIAQLKGVRSSGGAVPSVEEAIQHAVDAIQDDHVNASESYRTKTVPRYQKVILRSWGNLGLAINRVTSEQLQGWVNNLCKTYHPSTPNGCLALWNRAFARAVEQDWIEKAPVVNFVVKRAERVYFERKRAAAQQSGAIIETDLVDILPTARQFDDLVTSIRIQGKVDSLATSLVVEFLAATGLRNPSESLEIHWKDVDFDARDGKGTIRVTRHKGGFRRETLPLTRSAREVLLRIRKAGLARRGESRQSIVLVGEEGLLPSDRVLVIDSPRGALRNACVREGRPHLRVHDLRHLFCTRALEAGWSPKALARYVDHKDGGVLICTRYAHWCPEHAGDLADRI